MDTIALVEDDQKKVVKRVKDIKEGIKSKNIVIQHNDDKKRKGRRKKINPTIYLGSIPHGFYEEQMKSYFSQFGKVVSVNLARSSKTGRSKGFAFVQFRNEDVAKIAAETMNNYLMYNKVLKCRYIPPEERKFSKLKEIDPLNYPRKQNRKHDFRRKLSAFKKLSRATYQKKARNKIEKFKKFFEEKGINFSLNVNKNGSEDSANVTDNSSKSTQSTIKNDDEFMVLEIDESDGDIQFKTPPNVKKIFKKSIDTQGKVLKKEGAKSNVDKAKKKKMLMKAIQVKSKVKQKLRATTCDNLKEKKNRIQLAKNEKDKLGGARKKNNVKKSPIRKT